MTAPSQTGSPAGSSEEWAFAAVALLAAGLRREGLLVGADRTEVCARAAAQTGDLYWAGRLTLLSRAEDIPVYDRVYHRRPGATREDSSEVVEEGGGAEPDGQRPESPDDGERDAASIEVVRHTPLERLEAADVAALARAIDLVIRRVRGTVTRRSRSTRRGALDLRRTIREMQRHGGEVVGLERVRALRRPPRLTLVLDVSGSMRASTPPLLLMCAAFARALPTCEVLAFGTRVTRLTEVLRSGPVDEAVEAAADVASDRGGGTRMGPSLAAILRTFGSTALLRGATVVIYSDGLERGDPAELGHAMERLSRLARRVVWLNPLQAAPEYEPLARGMKAALPFVDHFASGHTVDSLEATVTSVLAGIAAAGGQSVVGPP